MYQPFIPAMQVCGLVSGGAAFLLGTLSGLWIFGRLDERRFRLLVLLLLLASGAAQLA